MDIIYQSNYGCIYNDWLIVIFRDKQDYIEFRDNQIVICSYKFESRISILKNILIKKENICNKHYRWDELDRVEIQLCFKKTSAGRQRLWTVYVLEFIFYFKDGFQYKIQSGLSLAKNIKIAYQILRNKDIEIVANDHIIDYLEQDELKAYDYFENIYHKNSKK